MQSYKPGEELRKAEQQLKSCRQGGTKNFVSFQLIARAMLNKYERTHAHRGTHASSCSPILHSRTTIAYTLKIFIIPLELLVQISFENHITSGFGKFSLFDFYLCVRLFAHIKISTYRSVHKRTCGCMCTRVGAMKIEQSDVGKYLDKDIEKYR